MTELLHLRDAYLREFDAVIVDVRRGDDGTVAVALDRTAFYATGGGQPHDTGTLAGRAVTAVRKDGDELWHPLADPAGADAAESDGLDELVVGTAVHGVIDWERRYRLMRTHSALHVLGGVVWNRWGALATGNNMEPLSARIDYEFDPLPEGFAADLERAINEEIALDRPIEISFLPTAAALVDPDLIRTKSNLIPGSVTEVRVVDIVGLDKQTDGGTHVRSTAEIGTVRVVKTESKGKANKRIRIEITDA
jgi:misacylated tRNA(Ala) deacylase